MTKRKSKILTEKNSQSIIKQSTKKKTRLHYKHQTKKLKRQRKKRRIKRKKVTMLRRPQNHQKNNIKRKVRRNRRNPNSNRAIERENPHRRDRWGNLFPLLNTNNNIFNRFMTSNFKLENNLNISHSVSPIMNHSLKLMNLNSKNNNDENFGFNFNIPLRIENNIINEISLPQNNDEELLDISALNTISCNHFNRIERSLFGFLPEVKIEDISNLPFENCLICLNNFLKDELITTLPCSHIFHCACIREWISFKKLCPLCRENIGGRRI